MHKYNLCPKNTPVKVFENSEELIDIFLTKNIECFELNLWDIHTLKLNVEDDIMFLADACTETFNLNDHPKHYVFLDDGGAIIEASLNRDNLMEVIIKLAPNLNVRNLHEKHIKMSVQDYLLSWRNLAYQISESAME